MRIRVDVSTYPIIPKHTMEPRRQPLDHRQVSRKRKRKKIVRRKVKKGRKGYYVRK